MARPSLVGSRILRALKRSSHALFSTTSATLLPETSVKAFSTTRVTFPDSIIYSESYVEEFDKLLHNASKERKEGLSISSVRKAIEFLDSFKSDRDLTIAKEDIYNAANSKKLIQGILKRAEKPSLIFLSVNPIAIDGEELGHVFCVYVDEGKFFLCDNNGNRYDDEKSEPNNYGSTKEGILEGARELGFKTYTNSNPTFDERRVCSFASLETISIASKMENPFEFLLKIDSLSKEERDKLFPTESIENLKFFRSTVKVSEPERKIEDGGRD